MTYTVQVKVMPLKELLDPQGKSSNGGVKQPWLAYCAGCTYW